MPIIERDRSIIPSCDVDHIEKFLDIVNGTHEIPEVGGYKVGFTLAMRYGLPTIVQDAKLITKKPIIYDHQKAATDIPDMGKRFAESAKNSGVDAVILFPQSGPITEYEWIKAAQEADLGVIVGGEMTHSRYLENDMDYLVKGKKNYGEIFRDEIGMVLPKGFIRRGAPTLMHEIAARMGVEDFVVPGNKPDSIRRIRKLIEDKAEVKTPYYYSPGLITQGGEISEAGKVSGERFHAIVGRGMFANGKGPIVIGKTVRELSKNL